MRLINQDKPNIRKIRIFETAIAIFGLLFGILSILGITKYGTVNGNQEIVFSLALGFMFAIYMNLGLSRKFKIGMSIYLIVFLAVSCWVLVAYKQMYLIIFLLLFGTLAVSYPVILLISKTKMKEEYKLSLYTSFAVFNVASTTAFLGPEPRITLASLAGIIGLIWLLSRGVERKWACTLILIGVFTLSFVVFGQYEYYLGDVITYTLALVVTTLLMSLKDRKKRRIALAVSTMILLVIAWIFPINCRIFLLNYSDNKKTQHEIVEEKIKLDYIFFVENDTVTPADMIGKDVTIMFWSSHCGGCAKKFPVLSELADEFAADTTKVFLAVYLPDATDDLSYYNETIKNSYGFTWASAANPLSILKQLNFNAVPHLTILDGEGVVKYNGVFSDEYVVNPRRFLK